MHTHAHAHTHMRALKSALIHSPSPPFCPPHPPHLTEVYLLQLPLLSCLHHLLQIGGHHDNQQVDANEGTDGDEGGEVDGTPNLHRVLSCLHPGDSRQGLHHLPGPLSLNSPFYEMGTLSQGLLGLGWEAVLKPQICCLARGLATQLVSMTGDVFMNRSAVGL